MTMTESTPERPLTPEAPAPPGKEHLKAPELTFTPPEGREKPDETGVSSDAGLVEPPD
jgi:hypothetical protein